MTSIAVMMSTFNGEAYVEEQINSILNQLNVKISLFIRDDGSKDKTISIISNKINQNPNIHLIQGENVGVGNSFMNLLYSTPDDYDFYAFSDQDDIWESEKICKSIELLKASDKKLYISNQKCVDKNGDFLNMRYKSKPPLEVIDVLSQNRGTGCTMVFNNQFKRLLCEAKRRPSKEILQLRIHDVWVTMVGVLTQSIVYDNNAYICYRQHENNVVGAFAPSVKDKFKTKINKLRNKDLRNGRSLLAKEVIEHYYDYAKSYPILFICANYKKNLKSKIDLIRCYADFSNYSNFIIFALYVIIGLF